MEKEQKLIDTIINHSCKIKEGDKVLIIANNDVEEAFLQKLILKISKTKAICILDIVNSRLASYAKQGATEELAQFQAQLVLQKYKFCDVIIRLESLQNWYENSIISKEVQKLYNKYTSVYKDEMIKKRWLYIEYPTQLDAHLNKKSFYQYKDFYLDVATVDYAIMHKSLLPLKELMEKTDKVRIVGNDTEINFSIKNMPAIICSGECNIPDGEIYTAPLKNSVNGFVKYNAPHNLNGTTFEDVKLFVENGKVTKVECKKDAELFMEYLEIDDGAKYFGEFALGVNSAIKEPIGNTLFDEKINGSFHLTLGNSYDDADNTNKSSLHLDLVCIQTPNFGGGEIYFDDVLIRKDGKFIPDNLKGLN